MSEMELKSRIDAEFLPFVHKPARFLGNEFHAVHKRLSDIHLRLALCFPEPYEEGLRHLSFELLYQILNDRPDTWAERCFAPGPEAEERLRETRLPLFSLESKTPLSQFDVVVFYLREVLSAPVVLSMLHLGGIGLRQTARGADAPLIIGCGPGLGNPEPLADFFDAIFLPLREAATDISEFAGHWCGKERPPKPALLETLSRQEGVYIPAFFTPRYNHFQEFEGMDRNAAAPADAPPRRQNHPGGGKAVNFQPLIPLTELSALPTAFEEYAPPVKSAEGPLAGSAPNRLQEQIFPPALARLYALFQQHLRRMEQVAVDFPLAFTYPTCDGYWEIAKEKLLLEEPRVNYSPTGGELNFRRPASAEIAAGVKQLPCILFPVAGSMRLRTLANVNLRDIDLLEALQALLKKGWRTVQLNFTIGLPTEKDEDINAIRVLVEKALDAASPYAEASLQVSVQVFSPRAHTPFQWEAAPRLTTAEQRLRALETQFMELPVRFIGQPPKIAQLITILSRGDRKIAGGIEKAWANGARFEGTPHSVDPEAWEQAFREAGIDPEKYLAAISISMPLPWDHLDLGISKTYLKEEKLRAFQGQLHPQNRDFVSFGLGGMRRSDFARFCRSGASPWSNAAPAGGSPATVPLTEEPVRYGRKGRKRQMTTAVIKQRIRIRYSKTGAMRFLAHPDIVRVFDRSARMAKIPLVYSQGLRRNPKISYGMPLPTGISSIAEYLDMEVEIGREIDLQVRFNEYLPEGIRILQYQGIYSKVPALAAVINRSTYEVLLPDREIPDDWIEQWLAQPQAIIQRQTKEGEKSMDIRPFVQRIEKRQNQLELSLDTMEGRGAKITEVLASLLAPLGIDYRSLHVRRTGQFVADNGQQRTPFEVI